MPFPAGSYPARVVADGAVAYWRLGETAGTTANDSIGTAHGTISGGVTLGQAGALSDGDKAMLFDGTTGRVIVANGAYATFGTGPFSVEAWIKPTAYVVRYVFDNMNLGGVTKKGIHLYVNDIDLIFRAGNGTAVFAANAPFPQDAGWHHIVGVNAGTLQLYIDGIGTTAPEPVIGDVSSVDPLRIGTHSAAGASDVNSFQGAIDEVAIYKTALTPTQIAAHYAARTFQLPPPVPWAVVGGMAWKTDMDSYNEWVTITPSDTLDLTSGPTAGVLVGGGGDVAAVMQNNRAVTLTGLPAGAWVPIKAKRINATGTTATNLVALYQR